MRGLWRCYTQWVKRQAGNSHKGGAHRLFYNRAVQGAASGCVPTLICGLRYAKAPLKPLMAASALVALQLLIMLLEGPTWLYPARP